MTSPGKERRPGVIPVLAGPGPIRWTCYVIAAWLVLIAAIGLYIRIAEFLSGNWELHRGDGAQFLLLYFAVLAVRWGRSRT